MDSDFQKKYLKDYFNFVDSVTSKKSKDVVEFIKTIENLNEKVDIPRLITSSFGLSGESGEFSEQVKKVVFQGKPLDNDVRENLLKELGDIIFYWANACMSLNFDPYDVIEQNIKKLRERYPFGFSENRGKEVK